MSALGVLSNDRSHTFRQAIESAAHVRRFAGHPDPRSLRTIHRLQTWQPDHPAASTTASNARTCSASNPGLTIRLRPFLSRISTLESPGVLGTRPVTCTSQELCRRVFLQPLLPHEKVRPAQTVLTTKHFHTLSATCVLGNQPSPLRPRLL